MPAIAQISVNFTNNEILKNPAANQFTNQVVSPFTLTQYLLYNRERSDSDFGITNSGDNLKYTGGFLTAGNKINIKHDSDLQLRQNLDVEQGIYVNNIYASRVSSTDYRNKKIATDIVRNITISPNPVDSTTNYLKVETLSNSRAITLLSNFGTVGTNSLVLNNTGSAKSITITTGTFTVTSTSISLGSNTSITGTLNVSSNLTITGSLNANSTSNLKGNLFVGTDLNEFVVAASTGNTSIVGSLSARGDFSVNHNKFIVTASSGNTSIAGTLSLSNIIDMNSNRITELGAPTQDTDAANKIYVDLATPIIISTTSIFPREWMNRIIRCNNTTDIDISIPNDANLPVGTEATFIRWNTGGVRFIASSPAVLRQADGLTRLYARWSAATLIKIDSTNWVLFGDLV